MSVSRSSIPVFNFDNDFTSVPVDTTTWLQLSASLGLTIRELEIFDSSGQVMEFGYGPAGSEKRLFLVMPGGNMGRIQCILGKGTRLVYRAVSAAAIVGRVDINGWY